MITKYIKAAVISAIKPIIDAAYFERMSTAYPYVRLELKRMGGDVASPYLLYADFYGKINEADELEEIADKCYKALNGQIFSGADIVIQSHGESMTAADDTAADIKHITANFGLRVYTEV